MGKPKFIKFWAEWCAPCYKVEPIFAELEREFSDRIDFRRVNVDQEQQYAVELNITSVPTLLLVADSGDIIADLTPLAFRKSELREKLTELISE